MDVHHRKIQSDGFEDDEKSERAEEASTEERSEERQQRRTHSSCDDTQNEGHGVKKDVSPDDKNVLVGMFNHRGTRRNYAIVPPSLISSQSTLLELKDFWGLPNPNFILEMNTFARDQKNYSNVRSENDIPFIESGTAPFLLQDVFFVNGDTENQVDNPNINDTSTNQVGDHCYEHGVTQRSEYKKGIVTAANDDEHINDKGRRGKKSYVIKDEDSGPHFHRQSKNCEANRCATPPDEIGSKCITAVDDGDRSDHAEDNNMDSWEWRGSRPSVFDLKLMNEAQMDAQLSWMNTYMNRKVTRILSAFVSAADMTQSWILCHGSPSMNEKLLEQAIDATRASPVILVVQGLNKKISGEKKLSDVLSEAAIRPRTLRDLKQNSEEIKLEDSGFDFLYNLGICETVWERGTHFIFSQDYETFDAGLLGPHGHVCVNGASDRLADPKRTGEIIRAAVTTIKPCILFNDTGAETQMYARLIKDIIQERNANLDGKQEAAKERKRQRGLLAYCNSLCSVQTEVVGTGPEEQQDSGFYEQLQIQLRRKAWSLRDDANQGNEGSGSTVYSLTIADVLQVIDLYCSNHRLFERVVVPVDPLNDSPDFIVKTLTLSFARSNMEAREVGSGDADINAVEQAWKIHKMLNTSKDTKNVIREILYFLFISCGFLTTTTSVLHTNAAHNSGVVQWVAICLAAVVTLSSGILNLTGTDAKLAKIRTAQAKIVFQIFQFRMRAGRYRLSPSEQNLQDEKSIENDDERKRFGEQDLGLDQSTNLSSAMHTSRQEFSSSLQHIVQELASVDLHKETLARGELSVLERQDLVSYVAESLGLQHTEHLVHEHDLVAVSGIMTSCDYYQLRVEPLLANLEDKECSLRWQTRGIQFMSMLLTVFATIFSAKGSIEWIPVIIAGATGMFQLLKVNDYERRFEIASTAARELRALDTFWRSLSDLDQNLRSSTLHMVNTCEQLALQFETDSVVTVDESLMRPDATEQPTKPLKIGDIDNA